MSRKNKVPQNPSTPMGALPLHSRTFQPQMPRKPKLLGFPKPQQPHRAWPLPLSILLDTAKRKALCAEHLRLHCACEAQAFLLSFAHQSLCFCLCFMRSAETACA